MKKYDSKLRKWVSEEAYNKTHKKRDSHVCKGGRLHDYVLVLPFHVTHTDKYKFNPEEYYRLRDELAEIIEKYNQKVLDMGVKTRYSSWRERKETRCFMCAVCKKQKYEYNS